MPNKYEFIVEVLSTAKQQRTMLKDQMIEYLVVDCQPVGWQLMDTEVAELKVFGKEVTKWKDLFEPGNKLHVSGTVHTSRLDLGLESGLDDLLVLGIYADIESIYLVAGMPNDLNSLSEISI